MSVSSSWRTPLAGWPPPPTCWMVGALGLCAKRTCSISDMCWEQKILTSCSQKLTLDKRSRRDLRQQTSHVQLGSMLVQQFYVHKVLSMWVCITTKYRCLVVTKFFWVTLRQPCLFRLLVYSLGRTPSWGGVWLDSAVSQATHPSTDPEPDRTATSVHLLWAPSFWLRVLSYLWAVIQSFQALAPRQDCLHFALWELNAVFLHGYSHFDDSVNSWTLRPVTSWWRGRVKKSLASYLRICQVLRMAVDWGHHRWTSQMSPPDVASENISSHNTSS